MIAWITAVWLAVHSTDAQVEALRASAPQYLTTETARQHLTAAWVAALATTARMERGDGPTHADPYMLLYIAWHESRYNPRVRTREPGGKTSCGVMTPVPALHCYAGTLVEQYVAGARHLQAWYDYCDTHKNERESTHFDNGYHDKCAITGYAGGVALIRACRHRGHMWRQRGRGRIDLCATAALYLRGADDLRDAIEKDIR